MRAVGVADGESLKKRDEVLAVGSDSDTGSPIWASGLVLGGGRSLEVLTREGGSPECACDERQRATASVCTGWRYRQRLLLSGCADRSACATVNAMNTRSRLLIEARPDDIHRDARLEAAALDSARSSGPAPVPVVTICVYSPSDVSDLKRLVALGSSPCFSWPVLARRDRWWVARGFVAQRWSDARRPVFPDPNRLTAPACQNAGPVAWMPFLPAWLRILVGHTVAFKVDTSHEPHIFTFGPQAHTGAIGRTLLEPQPRAGRPTALIINSLGADPAIRLGHRSSTPVPTTATAS